MKYVDQPMGRTKDGVSVFRRVLVDPLRRRAVPAITAGDPPVPALQTLNLLAAQE